MAVSALRDSKKIQKLTCKVLLFAVYHNSYHYGCTPDP
jgi:hypothetical protein